MTTPLNTIDQSVVWALLEARFGQPELYAGKPLFIWQAVWHDGIQLPLVMDVMRQDRAKPKEGRRYFLVVTLRADKDYREDFAARREGLTAGYVAYPGETLPLDRCLGEIERLASANVSGSPLVVYLPHRHQSAVLPDEQYIFEPDFEQWTATCCDSLIPDFIRGDGDKEGIIYRWYNCFRDPDKGVSTPQVWHATGSFLNGFVKVTKNYKTNYGVKDLDEQLVRSAFEGAANASKGHISTDVVDDFVKYLKDLQ